MQMPDAFIFSSSGFQGFLASDGIADTVAVMHLAFTYSIRREKNYLPSTLPFLQFPEFQGTDKWSLKLKETSIK